MLELTLICSFIFKNQSKKFSKFITQIDKEQNHRHLGIIVHTTRRAYVDGLNMCGKTISFCITLSWMAEESNLNNRKSQCSYHHVYNTQWLKHHCQVTINNKPRRRRGSQAEPTNQETMMPGAIINTTSLFLVRVLCHSPGPNQSHPLQRITLLLVGGPYSVCCLLDPPISLSETTPFLQQPQLTTRTTSHLPWE